MTATSTRPNLAGPTAAPAPSPDGDGSTGPPPSPRVAGAVLLGGFALMATGALVGEASGADLFGALESVDAATVGGHLADVEGARTALTANLSLWIAGVPMIALGVALAARFGRRSAGAVARTATTMGAAAAVVFYSLMMGVVRGLAPAHVAGEDVIATTKAVGWGAATADWVATFLVLGLGLVALVRAGRETWAPGWLVRFGDVTAVVAVVEVLALLTGARPLAFVLVPVGMALLAATGIVLVRQPH